jgi:hypothetical protein
MVKPSLIWHTQIGLKIRNVLIEQNKLPSIPPAGKKILVKSSWFAQMKYLYWINSKHTLCKQKLYDFLLSF